MWKNKKISLIIPCFNEEEGIGEIVKNIPYFIDEFIVVDNNSQDGSVNALETKFPEITILENKNNIGIFTVLFLVYLFLAMKRFYQQGIFKTFLKLCILSAIFLLMATIGFTILSVISFATY